MSSVIGTPATVEYRGSGTIVSPWPPRTVAWMFDIETPISIAMKARIRALSRMPAMPMTLCFGSFVTRRTTSHIASRGFVTTMILRSREPRDVFAMQVATISSFFFRRSSRDMPGLAGEAGRHDHEVGALGLLVAVRPDDLHVEALDGARLVHVEALALRDAFEDVHEDDVGQVLLDDALRDGRARRFRLRSR